MKDEITNRSYERKDSNGRKVTVTFVKKSGTLFWVRVCTFFDENLKLRSDYYKEDELFKKIVEREVGHPDIPSSVREWVLEKVKCRRGRQKIIVTEPEQIPYSTSKLLADTVTRLKQRE